MSADELLLDLSGFDGPSENGVQSLPVEFTRPVREFEIVVFGRPAPQGSKKGFVNKKTGRVIMVESSAAVKPWREDVKAAAERLIADEPLVSAGGELFPLDGPLIGRMVFTVPKPVSAPKGRRTWPDRMPDVSKLLRATEDALTDAGFWADDARLVDYSRLAKVFPGEDPESLDRPGVRIVVRRVVA